MNNTLTPQEAALYVNAEAKTDEGVGKVTAIDLETELLRITYGCTGPDYDLWCHLPTDKCQLLLRPLSDITEKEAKEIVLAGLPLTGKRFTKLVSAGNAGFVFNYKDRQGNDLQSGWGLNQIRSTQIQLLLSKGFDLFNWIEEGKALDKTKYPAIGDRGGILSTQEKDTAESPGPQGIAQRKGQGHV